MSTADEQEAELCILVSKVQIGDLLFFSDPLSLVSYTIEVLSESGISHVGVVGTLDALQRRTCYAQDWHFEQSTLFDYAMAHGTTKIMRYPGLRDDQKKQILLWCENRRRWSHSHCLPDYPLWRLGEMVLANFIHPGFKDLWFQSKGMTCSATVAELYLEAAHIQLSPQLQMKPVAMKPSDLLAEEKLQLVGIFTH